MPEPVSSTSTTASIGVIALLSLIPGLDAAVVLGAFSGAVVFVMSADDISNAKRAGFFVPAFLSGLFSAQTVASILGGLIPVPVHVDPGVGALFAAALAIKTLLWLMTRDPATLIDTLRGRR